MEMWDVCSDLRFLIGPNELFYGQALGERYSLRGRGQDDRDT